MHVGFTAASAVLKRKAAAVVLAAVVATGSAAGVAAAADHGAFGQQVKAQVATCKAHLAQGVHGIGDCVSDFAQQHGAKQRQQHSQSGAGKSNSSHGKSDNTHGGPPSGTPGASNGQGQGKP
jgi:hypothetical protein